MPTINEWRVRRYSQTIQILALGILVRTYIIWSRESTHQITHIETKITRGNVLQSRLYAPVTMYVLVRVRSTVPFAKYVNRRSEWVRGRWIEFRATNMCASSKSGLTIEFSCNSSRSRWSSAQQVIGDGPHRAVRFWYSRQPVGAKLKMESRYIGYCCKNT